MTERYIPYGRQTIAEEDIEAVVAALRSDWLTTGPQVDAFESEFAQACAAREGVAVNSGTAALHAGVRALGINPGDEVIVPAITFAATANAVVYEGGTPIFADICEDTLLIDPASIEAKLSPRTKAVIAVDFAGQPADYDAIRTIADRHRLGVIADACHSAGASYKGRPVGTLADISAFSFHPVKQITTAEGGMATTDDPEKAAHMRRFRNHGIDSDHRMRAARGQFAYDMVELGWNYRLNDLQCALGRAQLKRLPAWIERRRAIAARYDAALSGANHVAPLRRIEDRGHAYHLYVVRFLDAEMNGRGRAFEALRALGIGANVHYSPVYRHSFYRNRFGDLAPSCPVAERVYEEILTLPIYPALEDADVDRIAEIVLQLKN